MRQLVEMNEGRQIDAWQRAAAICAVVAQVNGVDRDVKDFVPRNLRHAFDDPGLPPTEENLDAMDRDFEN